jgi:hypothetical protein
MCWFILFASQKQGYNLKKSYAGGLMKSFQKFKPAARKFWLQLAAGLMWSGVGLMLFIIAWRWLVEVELSMEALEIIAGLLLAGAIYFWGFSKLAGKNIRRIEALPNAKPCLFAFQAWTSYPLVAVMIAMGIYLRVYSSFPHPLLAITYIGIGGGLLGSSLHYYTHLFRGKSAMVAQIEK